MHYNTILFMQLFENIYSTILAIDPESYVYQTFKEVESKLKALYSDRSYAELEPYSESLSEIHKLYYVLRSMRKRNLEFAVPTDSAIELLRKCNDIIIIKKEESTQANNKHVRQSESRPDAKKPIRITPSNNTQGLNQRSSTRQRQSARARCPICNGRKKIFRSRGPRTNKMISVTCTYCRGRGSINLENIEY